MFVTCYFTFSLLLWGGINGFSPYKRGIVRMMEVNGEGDGVRKYPISRHYYDEAVKRLNEQLRLGGGSIIIIQATPLGGGVDGDGEGEGGGEGEGEGRGVENDLKKHTERRAETMKTLMKRYENGLGTGTSAKSDNFEVVDSGEIGVRFSDIGGFMGVKSQLMQCLDMLKNWATYAQYSVRTPKGVVLEGPPGNGKTMLARAFAAECGVGFIAVSGAEFQDKYIGVGSSKVRELFNLAMENRPCIVFIDEIDALGGRRRTGGEAGEGSGAERDNTLNQLLVEMDGFRNNTGVFVIGATNRADLLDPALMRPGRIDKRIYVGAPDVVGRRAILALHIRGKPNELNDEQMEELVRMTGGFSGAQLENVLNEAMLCALHDGREVFNWSDIGVVYGREIGGGVSSEEGGSVMPDDVWERIAVHEIGHCLVAFSCKHHPLVEKVVINRESVRTPGATIFEEGGMVRTRDELFERIMILFGGQIAERIIYGDGGVSGGCVSDNEEARRVAQMMVIEYGMVSGMERWSVGGDSEKAKTAVDSAVEQLLSGAYGEAYAVLQRDRDCIVSGAAILKKDLSINRRDLLAYLML
jgi:ATP-dependent metalloprotease FtsH